MLIYEISRAAEYSEKQLAGLIENLSKGLSERYMDLYGTGEMNSDRILEQYFDLYKFFQNKFLEQFGSYYIPSKFPDYIEPLRLFHSRSKI